jgi:phytol kinase
MDDYKIQRENVNSVIIFEMIGFIGQTVLQDVLLTILICMGHFQWLPFPDFLFGVYVVLFFGIFFLMSVAGGYLVLHLGVDPMYPRKIIHVNALGLPFILPFWIPFGKNITTVALIGCMIFLAYIPLMEKIRNKSHLLQLAFASFDRPSDRPHTLSLAVTQSAATYFVMLPIGYVIAKTYGSQAFVPLVVMPVAFGDGLAEIVGRNWGGKYTYEVTALFTNRTYERSIPGSLCVYFATVFAILVTCFVDPGTWSTLQIGISLLLLPLLATVVEAKAPHSWDNALLLLSCGLFVIAMFMLPDMMLLVYDAEETIFDLESQGMEENVTSSGIFLQQNL